MAESTSVLLQGCLDRLASGDVSARNDLLTQASDRLRRLTHKMLRDYPGVRRWEETADVFQNAVLRLCRALEAVPVATVRDFYRLSSLQIRRELIDLARHHYGPLGSGAHHASAPPATGSIVHEAACDRTVEPGRLEEWTEFHDQADRLPVEGREVFDLLWYQGLSQEEAAAVVGVSVRTIKSRWRAARLALYAALRGKLPEG